MFMGEYNHTIDAKGRLIVPSRFREKLGAEFIVTKGLDECLFVYPLDEWAHIEEAFRRVPLTNKKARNFVRFFFAGAADLEADRQGRILLPPALRADAGLEKEIVSAGVLNRVEIWDKEKWERSSDISDMDGIADYMAGLGVSI